MMRMNKNANQQKSPWSYRNNLDLLNTTKKNKKKRKISLEKQNKKSLKKPKKTKNHSMKNQYLPNLKDLSQIKIQDHVFSLILKVKG